MQNNNQQLDAGQVRMQTHLETINGRYRRMCQELAELGYEVQEEYKLDELLFDENRQPTYEYFGILLRNIIYAMQCYQLQLIDQSIELKRSILFDMEPSMHTGET